MLGLQGKRTPVRIRLASLALDRSVEKVAGIELHPRLSGVELQTAPGLRIADVGGKLALVTLGVQHPVEIEATVFRFSEFQLRMIGLDVFADGSGLGEAIGVPATGAISPVGINVPLTGV